MSERLRIGGNEFPPVVWIKLTPLLPGEANTLYSIFDYSDNRISEYHNPVAVAGLLRHRFARRTYRRTISADL